MPSVASKGGLLGKGIVQIKPKSPTKPHNGGGRGEKIRATFFVPPPPLGGYPRKKKLAPHVGIFFRQEEFFHYVLLELAWHPHFATLYDIGT